MRVRNTPADTNAIELLLISDMHKHFISAAVWGDKAESALILPTCDSAAETCGFIHEE